MNLIKIKQFIKTILVKSYLKIQYIINPIEKSVLFESFDGRQYSDNPRAISEKLHELYPDYKIYWAIVNPSVISDIIPDYINIIPKKGIQFYKTLSRVVCYVRNTHLETDISKRKSGQLYIQTWHGDIGFKKVLYDTNISGNTHPIVTDGKYTDICISGSDYGKEQYRTAFHYYGEVLNTGTPRNDKLIIRKPEEEKKTKARLGISDNDKVLIYAPTFRDNIFEKQDSLINLNDVLKILNSGENSWVCLIRAHANSKGLCVNCDGETYIDCTTYPDISDILAIGDLLLTDYSSCAADFIRQDRGAILCTFDKEDYEKNCREIPFDFREAGFITANSQEELNYILKNFTEDSYKKSCRDIKSKFNIVESGKSSEIICKRIDEFYRSLDRRCPDIQQQTRPHRN